MVARRVGAGASRFNLNRPDDDKTKAEKDRKPMQIKLTFTLEYELILPLRVRPGRRCGPGELGHERARKQPWQGTRLGGWRPRP